MRIKFKDTQAGHSFVYHGGEVYNLPSTDALYWIRYGRAELVDDLPERPIVQEVKRKKARPVKRTVQ